MRISPLGIYAAINNYDFSKLKTLVNLDTALTHSNLIAQDLVAIWVFLIQKLINIDTSLNTT
jgi:ADP-ribosylglycohydrolase